MTRHTDQNQRWWPKRRVAVGWACDEHCTPPGQDCQGCADQGELFTHAEIAAAHRRTR